MRVASVFARPRNNADPDEEAGSARGPAPGGKDVCSGETFDDVSELKDCDLEDMGTVRLLIIFSCVFVSLSTWEVNFDSSSTGISSAAGIGRPLAAAASWFSVHDSEWSLRPLQNGAIRLSI